MLPTFLLISGGLLAAPATSVPADAVVISKLIDALGDGDPDVRSNIAGALTKLGPATVEPLITALSDASADRRAGAAYTLAQLGLVARPALPTLLTLLKDSDLGVRRQASFAVNRLIPAGGGR